MGSIRTVRTTPNALPLAGAVLRTYVFLFGYCTVLHPITHDSIRNSPAGSLLRTGADVHTSAVFGSPTSPVRRGGGDTPSAATGGTPTRRRRVKTRDGSTNAEPTSISGVGPSLRSGRDMELSTMPAGSAGGNRPVTAAGYMQLGEDIIGRRPSWFETAPVAAASLEELLAASPQLGVGPGHVGPAPSFQLGVVEPHLAAPVPRAAAMTLASGEEAGVGGLPSGKAVTPPSPHSLGGRSSVGVGVPATRGAYHRPASKRRPRHLAALEDSGNHHLS